MVYYFTAYLCTYIASFGIKETCTYIAIVMIANFTELYIANTSLIPDIIDTYIKPYDKAYMQYIEQNILDMASIQYS